MRLLHLVLIGALVAVPVVIVGSNPADAARSCKCISITSSGYCTEYGDCHDVLELVGSGTFTPFRSTQACRRSQALLCDYNSCKVVCDTKQK
jgi:hypothetical protein